MQPVPSASPSSPPDPNSRYRGLTPWSPFSAVAVTILIVAASLMSPLVVIGLSDGVGGSWGGGATVRTGSATFFAIMILSQLIMAVPIWWLSGWRGGNRREVLALGPAHGGWKTYVLAVAVMVSATTTFNLFRHFVLGHDIYADLRLLAPLFRQPLWPLSFLVVIVGAPLAEELLFRGFLQSALAQSRIGFVGAASIVTVLWAALHTYSMAGMILVGLLGVLFSWMLWWSGSLRVPLVAHAANNLIACLYLQFGPPM